MSPGGPLFDALPLPAFLFRVAGDDFVLEAVNAAASSQNPAILLLVGRPTVAVYADHPEMIAGARECARTGRTVVRELVLRRFDRTEATQPVRITFVAVGDGCFVGIMENVPSSDAADASLRESESRHRGLVASLPDAVVMRGADGRVLACNDVAVRLFGADSMGALVGKRDVLAAAYTFTWEDGRPLDPEDLPSLRVLRTGQPEIGVLLSMNRGGERRWLRVSAQPIVSATTKVTGSATVYTDVTDRVRAQDELRRSAARLDLALDAARMGVFEYDPAHDTGWSSPNLPAIFQLATGMGSLREFIQQVVEADRAGVTSRMQKALEARAAGTFENEFRVVGTDGVTRWARARGRVSFEGGAARLTGTMMDVTAQHELEEELRRAHRLESIGRLAGGIAHDFNNLLAAMLGSLDLVEDHAPAAAREDLATIRHGAARARDLTRQLLAFARKQAVTVDTVDLAALVGGVERMLQRLVGADVALAIEATPGATVSADPTMLEQVLVNLVVNARDAMPGGGVVTVRVGTDRASIGGRDPEDVAFVEVTDSGVGMDDETRRHVFEPFFTTKVHGTGLGLASSYGIVQQHGGDIVVQSEPGRGTRFRVVLPLRRGPAAHPADPARPVSVGASRGTVLVVDDEELVRRTAVRLLQSLGYHVLSAGSGDEAIAVAAAYPDRIDALLCDVVMPGRDGPSTAAALVAARPGLAVLFASGYAERRAAGEVSTGNFLQKPYDRAELAAHLAELLKAPGDGA